MRLPINQKNKNYEITCTYDIKFSSQTTVLWKIIMSGIEIIIFHAQTQLNMKLSFS